jgi:steroid delta-isomerase-like uncharacterized protein
MSESNKAIQRGAIEEVWNKGNLDAAKEYYAADVVIHGAVPGQPQGIAGVRQAIGASRAGFPDLHLEIEDIVAEGDRVVNRWTMTGTHKGEYMGISPTGKRIEWSGISLVRIAESKIAEIWTGADRQALMQQLGAVPS